LAWRQFVGRFGIYETERVLKKKIVRSPTEIICYTCVFLNYWAGLQKEEDPQLLEAGAAALQHNAVNLHPEQDGIPEEAEETAPAAL
jgi:hypothetical protein